MATTTTSHFAAGIHSSMWRRMKFSANNHCSATRAAEMGSIPAEYIQNVEDRLDQAEVLGDDEIPLVDFSSNRKDVVRAVAKACEDWGFFQAINHGVPVASIRTIFELASNIFDLPHAEKEAFNVLGERLSSACDDPSGAYRYDQGFVRIKGKATDWRDFVRLDYQLVKQLDVWPQTPSSFKYVVQDYNEHIRKFAKYVLDIISEALGLEPETGLSSFLTDKQIFLINYYPAIHKPELVIGATPHSDPRGITILLQDSVGGLEVRNQGKWFPVKPVENVFVVNVADQLQILTNDRYKSAEHRVRANAEHSRFSIPVFFGAAMNAQVGPLPELVSEKNGAVYRTCTAKDYLENFYAMGLAGKTNLDYVRKAL